MTKTEIQTALESIPEELKDVHPSQIMEYFQTTYIELSESETNILTANYVYNNLPFVHKTKPWEGVQREVILKYANLSAYDLNDRICPWIRLVHAQGNSGLTVVGVEN